MNHLDMSFNQRHSSKTFTANFLTRLFLLSSVDALFGLTKSGDNGFISDNKYKFNRVYLKVGIKMCVSTCSQMSGCESIVYHPSIIGCGLINFRVKFAKGRSRVSLGTYWKKTDECIALTCSIGSRCLKTRNRTVCIEPDSKGVVKTTRSQHQTKYRCSGKYRDECIKKKFTFRNKDCKCFTKVASKDKCRKIGGKLVSKEEFLDDTKVGPLDNVFQRMMARSKQDIGIIFGTGGSKKMRMCHIPSE